jgi:hypothetical protein
VSGVRARADGDEVARVLAHPRNGLAWRAAKRGQGAGECESVSLLQMIRERVDAMPRSYCGHTQNRNASCPDK